MNGRKLLIPVGAAVVGLLLGLGLGRVLDAPHPSPAAAGEAPASAPGEAAKRATFWTCSMHPQIRQPGPGLCPICGMELIPLETGNTADDGPRALTMSDAARALAEIETTRVRRAFPEVRVRLVGKLDYDETRLKTLSARFPARIDELFVNFTGIRVNQGDHLAVIYSPDLLTAQRELLTAAQYDPNGSTARVARDKLRLWDLQPDQIDAVIDRGVAQDHFELRAPIGGIVVRKNIKEGDYVKTGDPLFSIADLGVLWLPLEAYESDLPWLRYGQTAHFEVESLPGERFEGRIVFIDPLLDNRTRTVDVRVEVPNPGGRLKPGMFARAVVYSRIASGARVIAPELAGKWISPMHPEIIKDGPGKCDVCGMDLVPVESMGYVTRTDAPPPLLVPTSAVLRTGQRAVVYVSVPDRDRPTYEGREITLGPRAGDVFLVVDGLGEGEEVVTNGAFKIDSALQIQAKPSMMNPAGGAPAPGHERGAGRKGGASGEHASHEASPLTWTFTVEETSRLLDPYFRLQAALAGDDLPGAKAAVNAMLEAGGPESGAAGLLHAMLAADSLDGIRRPQFETLSDALAAAIRENESAFDRTVYVEHCPMVYPDRGADWLQETEETRNPYFGAAMLACGETKATIGKGRAAGDEQHGANRPEAKP